MESFQSRLDACLSEEVVSSLALESRRNDGSDIFRRYMGGPSDSWPNQAPVDDRTVFTLASCTKLPTTVAALQLVERQLITLETDVSDLLPVLGRQQILVGWHADGSPILQKRRNPITLRHLLTHSSGCGYDFYNRDLQRYRRFQGPPSATQRSTVTEWFDYPLVFEPGQGWEYGSGLDWAGRLVEQISGMDLEAYMRKYVWKPLGASSYTFWPDAPEYTYKLASLTKRNTATGKLDLITGPLDLNQSVKECFGGHGAYCSAGDYMELLFSLFTNDGRLLQPSSVEMMFQDQLSEKSRAVVHKILVSRNFPGDFYAGEMYTWGLGGVLILESHRSEAPYCRGPRTLAWCGATNQFWFIDRSSGLCGLFMTHVLPLSDAKVRQLIRAFVQYIYKENDLGRLPSFL